MPRFGPRSHETCVKDSIFAIQRASEKVDRATGYDEALAAVDALKTETATVKRLCDELRAFGEPSRWERSRMRRHRSLWTATNEEWVAAMTELRRRLDNGDFPPDLRQKFDDAIDAFDKSRLTMKSALDPMWN